MLSNAHEALLMRVHAMIILLLSVDLTLVRSQSRPQLNLAAT